MRNSPTTPYDFWEYTGHGWERQLVRRNSYPEELWYDPNIRDLIQRGRQLVALNRLHVNRHSPRPLYEQLADQFRQLIRAREWTTGDRLPAVRDLAKRVDVSVDTVERAYGILREEGWVQSRSRRGTVVAARVTESPVALPKDLAERSEMLGSRLRAAADRPGVIAVSGIVKEIDRSLLQALQQEAPAAVADATKSDRIDPLGLSGLRSAVQGFLTERGIFAQDGRICIVNGTQQGLEVIARLTVRPGSLVFVPAMCYLAAREIFLDHGARVQSLPISPLGVDLRPLEDALDRKDDVALVYAMPNGHYPTGWSWTDEQKSSLLQLAGAHGFSIAEDDYYGGFYYEDSPPMTLCAMAQEDIRLFYLQSFSSLVHPSLRLGALIVPEGDSAPVERIKYLMDIGTSPFAQHLLLRVWRTGAVSRHLESRLPRLRAKLQDVFASCRKWLPADCEMVQPEAGLSFWVATPVPTDLKFVDLCLRVGVLAMPGRAFETDVDLNGFQVHLEASDSRELDEGLRRIAQVIATVRRSGSKSQPQITSKSFP